MTNASKISPLDLADWRKVAAQALEKLPPNACKRLDGDPEEKKQEIETLALLAWSHFQVPQAINKQFVDQSKKEIQANRKSIEATIKRVDTHIAYLCSVTDYNADEQEYEKKKYSITKHALIELLDRDLQFEKILENTIPRGNTSNNPLMEKYVHDLMLFFARLTRTAPADLKLSATAGPRTYLMNFLITIVNPIPYYSEVDQGDLARRVYRMARPIMSGPFRHLRGFPPGVVSSTDEASID